tara:strand:+ start:163 stop:507 length:345 start_codon:yes stop_codon:yes gene_type:complete
MNAIESIYGYHAHVYYRNVRERAKAAALREILSANPNVRIGRWRDAPVGPHPIPMYQVAFTPELFSTIVPWLMLNRDGLTVLIHPETNDHGVDHRHNSLWLGEKLDLDFAFFDS